MKEQLLVVLRDAKKEPTANSTAEQKVLWKDYLSDFAKALTDKLSVLLMGLMKELWKVTKVAAMTGS